MLHIEGVRFKPRPSAQRDALGRNGVAVSPTVREGVRANGVSTASGSDRVQNAS